MIEIKNLEYSIGNKKILNKINLEFTKGKIYGILGPNGSGKSTLLDIMVRHKEGYSGEIQINGHSHREYDHREFGKMVSLVPQEFDTHFNFTAREILAMGRYPYDSFYKKSLSDDEVIKKYVNLFSLHNLLDKDIHEMSGGEKQRVIFAKAMIQESRFILLDEATSNLDIHYSHTLFKLLKEEILKEEKSVIAVIHDINLAAQYCDEIYILKGGEIMAKGKVDETLTTANISKSFHVKSEIFQSNGKKVIATFI